MDGQTLTTFVESVCGDSHLRVEADLGDGFVRLRSAEAERRQAAHDIRSTEDIVIEMLRNARDAHAKSIFLAVSREGQRRRLVMIDDGDGVPAAMHERIFEPRVTSKLDSMHMDKWGIHGRGMALYSIAVNAETARVVASDAGKGAALFVETNLDKLGEKTDQSSFPVFERTESGSIAVRGPKNILRTACEFAGEADARPAARPAKAPAGDARGLRIAPEDLESFSRRVACAFSDLARDYYLESAVKPDVRVGKDGVHIRIPVEKLR